MSIINKFNKWFDLNISWFFINGRKQEEHAIRLEKKYGNKN